MLKSVCNLYFTDHSAAVSPRKYQHPSGPVFWTKRLSWRPNRRGLSPKDAAKHRREQGRPRLESWGLPGRHQCLSRTLCGHIDPAPSIQ